MFTTVPPSRTSIRIASTYKIAYISPSGRFRQAATASATVETSAGAGRQETVHCLLAKAGVCRQEGARGRRSRRLRAGRPGRAGRSAGSSEIGGELDAGTRSKPRGKRLSGTPALYLLASTSAPTPLYAL
ncbi:hypothetical protein [Streptomyces sp. NPDC058964]|uniref:hypothetical protein n=1 Tax=Streptomyces sp. NPDC058964 TaxID=3346681 RepID=UPI0036B33FCF